MPVAEHGFAILLLHEAGYAAAWALVERDELRAEFSLKDVR